MSPSISPDRINGAVLLLNEVYRTHSKKDARRLHSAKWRDYVDEVTGEHLDTSTFLGDAERSGLLMGTIERTLDYIGNSRAARAISLKFGIDDEGQFRTNAQVREALEPEKTLTREGLEKLMANGFRRLRHPARNYLRFFYGEKSTAEIGAELQELPQLRQRIITRP